MKRFVITSGGVVVVAMIALASCLTSFGDSPLGASGNQRVVAPGEAITGRVINPDGDIIVTLTAASTPFPGGGKNTAGAQQCAYDDGDYSCQTEGLSEGAYRVEVTDKKWPSEGVHFVEVVVTSIEDYNPTIALTADKNSVRLSGWAPGRAVTLTVTDRDLALVVAGPLTGTPDERGELTLEIGTIKSGDYAFDATDGLWSPGTVDNGWDPLFLTI